MKKSIAQLRGDLDVQPSFSIYDIHCARGDILIERKVNAVASGLETTIKSVVIGKV